MKEYRKTSPWFLLLFCFLGMTLLTSCASIGRQFQLGGVDQITVGSTSMSEARALLGNPLLEIDVATWGYKRMHFGDESTATLWKYIYASGSILGSNVKTLEVEFNKDGVVSDYYFTSSFNEDKINEPKNSEERDFDIFLAKDQIIPGKTNQMEVLTLLGKARREMSINKPGTHVRWIYDYQHKSNDEKVNVPVSTAFSTQNVEINKYYGKFLFIDFNQDGKVVDIRGESDFPADKDKFFTK